MTLSKGWGGASNPSRVAGGAGIALSLHPILRSA